MGQTDRHTYGTDRHTWPTENSFYARNFFVCAPIPGLGFFQTPEHTNSQLSFIIGYVEITESLSMLIVIFFHLKTKSLAFNLVIEFELKSWSSGTSTL